MEAGDDRYNVAVDAKEQTVWKAPQSRPAHIRNNDWKLLWTFAYPPHLAVNFRNK